MLPLLIDEYPLIKKLQKILSMMAAFYFHTVLNRLKESVLPVLVNTSRIDIPRARLQALIVLAKSVNLMNKDGAKNISFSVEHENKKSTFQFLQNHHPMTTYNTLINIFVDKYSVDIMSIQDCVYLWEMYLTLSASSPHIFTDEATLKHNLNEYKVKDLRPNSNKQEIKGELMN